MRIVLSLLLAIAVSAQAQERTVNATFIGAATLDEIAAMPFVDVPVDRPERTRPSAHRETIAIAPPHIDATPTVAAPALGRGFLDVSNASFILPADASGAVSARQVVGANNAAITVRDRDGKQLSHVSLSGMWQTLGAYDPRLLYDPAAQRWIAVALRDDGASFTNSKLLIAISDGDDATGSWHRFTIPIDANNRFSADFPRVGLAQNDIVITSDLWTTGTSSSLAGAEVRVIARSAAYSATTTLPVALLPQQLTDLTPVSVQDPGDPSAWFLYRAGDVVNVMDTHNGAQLAAFSCPMPSLANCCGLGPQLGSPVLMDVGAEFLHYAIVRGKKLWMVQSFAVIGELNAVLVWNVDLRTRATKVWMIDDPGKQIAYAFPSIAINKAGAALVGYSIFHAGIYPSAAFTYIAPNGAMSAPAILKNGSGAYTIARWGDFSTTVVDPADDTSFWTVQTIALTPTSTSPVWATWWTEIPLAGGLLKHHAAHH